MKTYRFYSFGDFLRDASGRHDAVRVEVRSDPAWWGYRNLRDAIDYAKQGASENETKDARDLFDKIDSSFRDRDTTAWMPSVSGAYPIVPDYLMGRIDSMRARVPVESEIAPIKVHIEPTVSAGVAARTLQRRGAAMAALVMRMAEERPVELWVSTLLHTKHGSEQLITMKIDATPLSLAQVVMLFHPSFARCVMLNYALTNANTSALYVGWGRNGMPGPEREQYMRKLLELEPQDILIQGGYLPDANLMDSHPVEWVHKQLEKQRTVEVN